MIKSRSIEPRTSAYRENAAGLSVAGWSFVLGAYARSFSESAKWICAKFAPNGPPFIDLRPRSDEFEIFVCPTGFWLPRDQVPGRPQWVK